MGTYPSSTHCLGEANWHIQLTPAFRQDIFRDTLTRELTVAYLLEAAKSLGIHVGAIECGSDHIHLFLQETRKVSVVSAVQKLWGKKFWSGGYFYQTVGTVTAASVKKYVEDGQAKHWEKQDKQQMTLFNYSSSSSR